MAAKASRVLFYAESRRSHYFRRFLWLLLGTLTAAGAYLALQTASQRGVADPLLLDVGQLIAIILAGLFAVRGVYSLILGIMRPSQAVQLYSKGFLWTQRGKTYKYRWTQLARFREGARGIYLFRRPLLQWGAHQLQMDDERVFRFTGRLGSPRHFAHVARPYAAYVTSVKMSRALRDDRPVRLHPQLTLYPGGVEAGKTEIHWSQLAASVKKRQLTVQRFDRDRFRTVRRYALHRVDNVGGFLEIVTTQHNRKKARRQEPSPQPPRSTGPAPSDAVAV